MRWFSPNLPHRSIVFGKSKGCHDDIPINYLRVTREILGKKSILRKTIHKIVGIIFKWLSNDQNVLVGEGALTYRMSDAFAQGPSSAHRRIGLTIRALGCSVRREVDRRKKKGW